MCWEGGVGGGGLHSRPHSITDRIWQLHVEIIFLQVDSDFYSYYEWDLNSNI